MDLLLENQLSPWVRFGVAKRNKEQDRDCRRFYTTTAKRNTEQRKESPHVEDLEYLNQSPQVLAKDMPLPKHNLS